MKLLVCISEYPPNDSSGAGNVAYNIVEQFKEKGIDCTVCSPTGPDIKLGSNPVIRKYGRGLLRILYYWHRVSKYFKENNFDVVWLHNPLFFKNGPFQRILITIHTTYHGYIVQGLNPKIYYKSASKIERYCLNKVKEGRFTGVSLQVNKELEEIGIKKERITYIPNGVDTKRFKPSGNKKMLRKKFGIPEENLMILSVGRLSEQKQPLKLIEVFSKIETEIEDATLAIAGKGELLEGTKELAKEKKLKNVRFLGYVDEKEKTDLYACSDFYVMTSKYEGQPLTLLEAMSSGLPCIVSDIPNLGIVEDAGCGIIVDFDDSGKAAEKIIAYLERDNLDHSKNAREYVVNNMDWEIIARKYLEKFEEVIQ